MTDYRTTTTSPKVPGLSFSLASGLAAATDRGLEPSRRSGLVCAETSQGNRAPGHLHPRPLPSADDFAAEILLEEAEDFPKRAFELGDAK